MNKEQKDFFLYGLYCVSISIFIFTLFFYSIQSSLPRNVLTLPYTKELFMSSWFPQGWGFYSKNPREEGIKIYHFDTEEPSTRWPHNSMENLFGLIRVGRAQGIEVGLLKTQIPEEHWQSCQDNPFACKRGLAQEEVYTIRNSSPFPTICGKQLLVMQEPFPWAWAKYKNSSTLPSRIVGVNVECSES